MTDFSVGAEAKPCDHEKLIFGCASCIKKQRDGWSDQRYSEFCKKYSKDKSIHRYCPDHKTLMLPYTRVDIDGKLKAVIGCQQLDSEGCFWCEDHDVTVVIG